MGLGWFSYSSLRPSALACDEDYYRECREAWLEPDQTSETERAELRRLDAEREREAERDTVARTHCGQCHARPGEPCRGYDGGVVVAHHIRRDARLRLVLTEVPQRGTQPAAAG
jgi:hypothetical protein